MFIIFQLRVFLVVFLIRNFQSVHSIGLCVILERNYATRRFNYRVSYV